MSQFNYLQFTSLLRSHESTEEQDDVPTAEYSVGALRPVLAVPRVRRNAPPPWPSAAARPAAKPAAPTARAPSRPR